MGLADLAEAAEAFLHHFLGRRNWILWTELRQKHGFHTNQEFASWILQVIQKINASGLSKRGNEANSNGETNNNETSVNSNVNGVENQDNSGHGVTNGRHSSLESSLADDDCVFELTNGHHEGEGKITNDHSALNLSNMLSGGSRVRSASMSDLERKMERPSTNGISLDLSVGKGGDMNGIGSDEEEEDDDEVDKPLNVQQFNKGGVRPRGQIEQICCTSCCKSFPTEALYNSHTCIRSSKDRRKSSEPSRFVAPGLMEDDDDDSIGLYDCAGREENKSAVMNGSLHACNVCNGIFPNIESLKAHGCKLRIRNGEKENGYGEDSEYIDKSPLSVDYWEDENVGEEGAMNFSTREFLESNGCGMNGMDGVVDEMEGIVGSSSLSQSGVSSISPDPRLVPCNMCGKMLMGQRAVIRHIRTVHMRIRKFHCGVCDRRFARNEHLKRHKCSRRSRVVAL